MSEALEGLTLSQLRVLDAVLEAGSVTRAARQLGMTQSAASHALRTIRGVLEDPILVRGAGGFVPTTRAAALGPALRRALHDLDAALRQAGRFEPATARRRFTLAMSDYFAPLVLPGLMERITRAAPGIDLDIVPPITAAPGGDADALALGAVDAVLTVGLPDDPGLRGRRILTVELACVVRADHPAVGDGLDLDTFCALPHALMSPTGRGPGTVDEALAALGRSRHVRLRIRYFLAAPLIVARSDLILTGPRPMMEQFARMAPLRLFSPPLDIPTSAAWLVWHERADADPAHTWLRDQIVAACQDL